MKKKRERADFDQNLPDASHSVESLENLWSSRKILSEQDDVDSIEEVSVRVLGFLLAYLIPVALIIGYGLGGWFNYLVPLLIFVAIPALDLILGEDRSNPDEAEVATLQKRFAYRLILFLYVPLQVGLVIWGAYVVTHVDLTTVELIGFVLSMGLNNGAVGITIAHELGHKPNTLERTLSKILLWTVFYMHFYIEHNKGHHANVGTPKDPATARFGESFYRFYPRTVLGSVASAWRIETKRLRRKGYAIFGWHNQMLWFGALQAGLAGGLGFAFGWLATVYFLIQSVIAFSLLEVVNYIEHYGLRRREIAPGRYEKVTELHSWNASHLLTNYFLFELQRHSDHHAHAQRRYQVLRHFEESPQLPTGYAGMVLLALVPPLWHRVMDRRVQAYYSDSPMSVA